MSSQFQAIFRSEACPVARGKFLSRVFGIFSEEIVSLWAKDTRAPYETLGRPTIKTNGDPRGHTLDFALRDRATRKVYVAEMKCEIEFQRYRYFVLERVEQLEHHGKPAFAALLKVAARSRDQTVYVGRKAIAADGAILIWGCATPEGRKAVIDAKGFHDVLTIEQICRDLSSWRHQGYVDLLAEHHKWCSELFFGLANIPSVQ
jgi:hypothetical protein